MTRYAAFRRDEEGIRALLAEIDEACSNTLFASLADPQLVDRLRLRDMMITQRGVLSAMLESLRNDTEQGVLMTRNGKSERVPARLLPERDLWFERVWQAYRKKEGQNG